MQVLIDVGYTFYLYIGMFLQDGAKVFPPQLSTPPTPFADRETLEKELKALEQDLGDLRSLTNPSWLDHDANPSYADSITTGKVIAFTCRTVLCFST